jgi:hypothetical protein
LHRAALELPLDDGGIDSASRIVHHGIGEEARVAGFDVHVHHRGLGAEGPGDGGRIEIGAGVESRLAERLERPST